jgi:thioester reductase-like protein
MTPAAVAELESTIAAVAARCLPAGAGPGRIDVDTPFALLGLDSLGVIELGAALEEALGMAVPPELFVEASDARSLAASLRRSAPPAGRDNRLALMRADAVLPADVRPRPGISRAAAARLDEARAVLVTGATGFLGASIVAELVERSRAQVHCLVRGGDRGRLMARLEEAGLDAKAFGARIVVVGGDLKEPGLGLSERATASLAREVDAICHAGAEVNWVYPYEALRAANVGGTLELIRLACSRAIPLHFVSSLSVCYAASGPRDVDESYDGLAGLGGVHLGYAQTKIVAEALVRQAEARGLAAVTYRPAILSGDSTSGRFNPDDVLAALVRGCVQMGTAPDLDWQLDCLPVDVVARSIVRMARPAGGTFHLKHGRPRHWRECVLWMRLYGYPLRLLSYHAWLRQLEAETSGPTASNHPLRALRSFFLERRSAAGGLTLPELYEDCRRTHAQAQRSERAVADAGVVCPPLDAALLDRYFDAYVRSGFLAPVASGFPGGDKPRPYGCGPAIVGAGLAPARVPEATSRTIPDDFGTPAFFSRALGTDVRSTIPLGSGSDHSIVSELAAWRTKTPSGLFRYRIEMEHDGQPTTRDVMVKAKPRDRVVIDVGEAVAQVCGDRVGKAYAAWSDRIGFAGAHEREIAIYRQADPRFLRHTPALLGSAVDEAAGRWVLILEQVTDGVLMDAVDRPVAWSRGHLARVVRGLASLQAIWLGREDDLGRQPWIGHVHSATSMAEMTELWLALADHASPAFSVWADPAIARAGRHLIETVADWWTVLERGPRTLIHHDFNPRNICLRRKARTLRLCAYDWELATVGAPQRDLAELLCFVLPADAPGSEIDFWIEQHRRALSRESGSTLDPADWRRGFRASVFDLLVNRLPMYALVHRIRRQAFLPRIVQTWRRLYEHVRHDERS